MQLIAEAYDMMRGILSVSVGEMADVFDEWNRGDLESFLIEITTKILRVKDPKTNRPLVDLVLVVADQKGTGKWTSDTPLVRMNTAERQSLRSHDSCHNAHPGKDISACHW